LCPLEPSKTGTPLSAASRPFSPIRNYGHIAGIGASGFGGEKRASGGSEARIIAAVSSSCEF
jgi:hypothetical protein